MSYKIGKRVRLLSDDMKKRIIVRYNGKLLDEHFPKTKSEKIRIACIDCGVEYNSNNYDFLNKYPDNRCISCVQIFKWSKDHERLSNIRKTDEYRNKMSVSLKTSEKYKKCCVEKGKNHTLYWDKIRGFTKEDYFSEWILYKKIVYNMTEKVYRQHKGDINPDELPRMEYNLDHMFSVLEGFKNNIPPYIISNMCNLEIIPRYDNLSKGCDCSITKEELMKMFFDKGERPSSVNL